MSKENKTVEKKDLVPPEVYAQNRKEIRKQLGINAQPLPKYGQASIEKYN